MQKKIRSQPAFPTPPKQPTKPTPPQQPTPPQMPAGAAPAAPAPAPKQTAAPAPAQQSSNGTSDLVNKIVASIGASGHGVDVAAMIASIDLDSYRDASGKITCPVPKEIRDQLKYGA